MHLGVWSKVWTDVGGITRVPTDVLVLMLKWQMREIRWSFAFINCGLGINVSLYKGTSFTVSLCVCAFSPSSQSEREEFETEYKQEYERERVLLTEENKKLSSELDKVPHLYLYTKWLSAHKPGSSLSVFSELSTHTNTALWPQLTPNSFITFLLHPALPPMPKKSLFNILRKNSRRRLHSGWDDSLDWALLTLEVQKGPHFKQCLISRRHPDIISLYLFVLLVDEDGFDLRVR